MTAMIDRTGQRFWRLLVLRLDTTRTDRVRWLAQCDCGRVASIPSGTVGKTKSCGCLTREVAARLAPKNSRASSHKRMKPGRSGAEYGIWTGIKMRCLNPNVRSYHRYGGRGIGICGRWMVFENFLADMGPRPSGRHQVDRVNNDGNYEPGNCRWATRIEQARNKSNTLLDVEKAREIRRLWAAGKMAQTEIATMFGVRPATVNAVVCHRNWREAC